VPFRAGKGRARRFTLTGKNEKTPPELAGRGRGSFHRDTKT